MQMPASESGAPEREGLGEPRLELFSYIPESALVVVAHPDDADFLAAALLSCWCRQGCRGAVCVVTDGDAGSDDASIPLGELSRIRMEEQRRASAHLGVSEVRCLGYPDGLLQPGLELRRDLVRLIRELRPEALVTMDPSRRWFGRGYLNHPDHRAAADAALDAAFPSARDARVFPELVREEGLQPHKVRFVLVGASEPDIAVPLEPRDIENQLAALGEHRSQFDASEMGPEMEREAREGGARAGVAMAATYKLFDLVPNPSQRGYQRQEGREEGLPAPPEQASQWG